MSPVLVGAEEARDGQRVAQVTGLATAPVKGLRLQPRDAVALDTIGATDDRRFFLIDHADRMVNARQIRRLSAVVARYDPARRRLALTFPDGTRVEGEIELAEPLTPRFFSRRIPASLVHGPWAAALTRYTRREVRLVMVADDTPGTDRGRRGAVSLMSGASVAHLEGRVGHAVDPRRFRMLIEVDGVHAHAEDAWVGRRLRIGQATVRFHGHVGRCIVTGLDPDTGRGDMPTLELLRHYRSGLATTEKLPFGIFGEVLIPGVLRRGDDVRLLD